MTDFLQRWNQLGPEIKRRYTAMGMSQRQFCAAAGVSDTFLRPVERGEATALPRVNKLAAVSIALGLLPATIERAVYQGLTIDEAERSGRQPQQGPPVRAPGGAESTHPSTRIWEATRRMTRAGLEEVADFAEQVMEAEDVAHARSMLDGGLLDGDPEDHAMAAQAGDPRLVDLDDDSDEVGRPSPRAADADDFDT